MSDEAVSQDTGSLPAADSQPSAPALIRDNDSFSDPSEAARVLNSRAQEKRKQAQEQKAQENASAPAQQPQHDSGEQPDGEQPEAAPAETTEAPDTAQEPPIEPPRSWPKEDKEFFAQLPRQAQERIAQREQERDRHFLQSQNKISEQQKAAEAHAQKLEQQRQTYEAQLPLVTQAIQSAIANEFPDIRTMEDVQKLAREDWPRYVQWDAKQKQLAQWQTEAQAAQQRQQQEETEKLQTWAKSQDEEVEKQFASVPESERKAIASEAKAALIDYGLTEERVASLWQSSILRSAPLQRIMADAARYRIAKKTASKPAPRPVPPVQRPGSNTQARTTADDSRIAALEGKDSLKPQEAAELLELKAKRRAAA